MRAFSFRYTTASLSRGSFILPNVAFTILILHLKFIYIARMILSAFASEFYVRYLHL